MVSFTVARGVQNTTEVPSRGLSALADRRIEGWPIGQCPILPAAATTLVEVIVKLMPSSMSTITYRYRVKDQTSRAHLLQMTSAINYVWNYCNKVSLLAYRRDKTFLSAYDLHKLTAGTSKDLRLSADTIQQVCTEYVTRRRQCKKIKLKWRAKRRSLGWIPFKAAYIRLEDDTITYCGHRFRLCLFGATVWAQGAQRPSRPVAGVIKTGSFTQDARGRWYVNFQCEVPDALEPAGQAEIANRRTDWTHKATTAIARRAKLTKMALAKSTYDAAWHSVRCQLTYKAQRLAGVCVSGRETFSSVTCSGCGARSGPSGLSGLEVRAWVCSSCGVAHNRDVNAARNILALRTGRGTPTKGIRLL